MDLIDRFKKIKLLALDFDGVMTVGAYVWTDQNGIESVQCSRRDGLGLEMLRKKGAEFGLAAVVISKEENPVVAARCRKLQLDYTQGVEHGVAKLDILKAEAQKRGLKLEQVAFMGDDVVDITCMKACGLGIAVADAHPKVLEEADYVTKAEGGRGAAREICEMLLQANGVSIEF